ncbi:MAG: hypothetical protein ACREQA_16070, partial [Candidatus Binatia bacterium]
HHGFRYLSDELAPLKLETMEVYPYPRAICLKKEPPGSYPLPKQTLYTSRTMHVPIEYLPSEAARGPIPLAAIFFLRYCPKALGPLTEPISTVEAGARLFANALNPLAHPEDGLDAAIEITRKCHCFELLTGDLRRTCELVKATMEKMLLDSGLERDTKIYRYV